MKSRFLLRYFTAHTEQLINSIVWMTIIITLCSLIYVIASFWSQSTYVTTFFNPDIVQDVYAAHNLLYEQGSLMHWHFSQAPYYFPDIIFFYIAEHFIKTIGSNLPLFALFQILALFSVLAWIFRLITKSNAGTRLGILSALFFLFMICLRHNFAVYGEREILYALLVPAFHFGGALVVFTCFALFLKMLDKMSYLSAILLSVLLILGSVSDPLVQIYFTIPTLATFTILAYFGYIQKNVYWKITMFLVSIGAISFLIYHFLPFPISKEKLVIKLHFVFLYEIFETIGNYYIKHHLLLGLAWLAFVVFAPRSVYRSLKKEAKVPLIDYALLFWWIAIITALPILWLTMGTQFQPLLNQGIIIALPIRYMIPFFLGPSLIGFPLLIYKHWPAVKAILKKNIIYMNILLVICVIVLLIRPNMHSQNLLSYYPELVSCVDQHAKKLGLHNGIGENWLVHMVTDYSRADIHVARVKLTKTGFVPMTWISTSDNFRYKNYDFYMGLIGLNNKVAIENQLIKQIGQPDTTFRCSQYVYHFSQPIKFKVFVYRNGKLNNVFGSYLQSIDNNKYAIE